MINLYYDATPNGRKILMMLEEIQIPYQLRWVEIDKGQQFDPLFRTRSPSAKIPVIEDSDTGTTVFESGAILMYLAEKTGQLLPADEPARSDVMKWLFWQTSTFGPMVGQATHFHSYASQIQVADSYASERYAKIVRSLYEDLDRRLATTDYVAGEFSIADIALYPWVRVAKGHGVDTANLANVNLWAKEISKRACAKVKPQRPDGSGAFKTFRADNTSVWDALFANQKSPIQKDITNE
ncbi:glutathione S-transferase family protein [Cognatishimia activa]|uniref:Disulfide-bond oxidoreductase YfcG n=1 Tax=Cognatishimia activa TaxID=1715691 RepID=A0A0P1IPX1_9RHOB|nr:glutathione S-transferase N-terminal domain-containing protein [Cognatishimia activa]CUI85017.1 Disulfide-bond oxidoreductase YfcG [Cognatishimia activa]CUK25539.1 Disulfide-bond oxidoreductase YfcG [Cognatishimia activa]